MTGVLFRPEAEADLIAIAIHIAEHSPERAAKLIARLRQRCKILETSPLAGRPRPEIGLEVRSLVEGAYIIFYRPIGHDTEIVAIVHGARDLPAFMLARLSSEP